MEIADVVRLLVAASRTDRAAAAADNEVIPTFRDECGSRSAEATLARARGDAHADEILRQAAESGGRSAIRSRNTLHSSRVVRCDHGADSSERSPQPASDLRLASESVAALSAYHTPMSA